MKSVGITFVILNTLLSLITTKTSSNKLKYYIEPHGNLEEKVEHYCTEVRDQGYYVALDDEDIKIVWHHCNDAYKCYYKDKTINQIRGEQWNCPKDYVYPKYLGVTDLPATPACVKETEVSPDDHPCGKKVKTEPEKITKTEPEKIAKTEPRVKQKPDIDCGTDDREAVYMSECPDSATVVNKYMKLEVTPQTDKQNLEIHNQNKRLLVRLLDYGIFGQPVKFHRPVQAFRLLHLVTTVYSEFCPSIPLDFINNIFQLFHDLHWNTAHDRTEILREGEYKWIYKLLSKCTKSAPVFEPIMSKCKDVLLSADNCTNYICTEPKYEFNLNRTDPVVDAIWKIYELVHTVCFPYFEESYRMYHKFAQVMMDLFTKPIRFRWVNQLADDNFWKLVLGPQYQTHLVNMERCNKATIERSLIPHRIPRHTLIERPRLHGDPGRIPVCRGDNKNIVLQFALVQDATSSYTDFVTTLADIMPDFLKEMTKEFPHSQYALTSFVDFVYIKELLISGSLDPDTAYCYKLEQRFTKEHEPIIKRIPEIVIQSGGADGPESSLTAVLYTAVDSDIGWASERFINGKKVFKVLVMTTDQPWKELNDLGTAGYLPPKGTPRAKGDGRDTCDNLPPDANLVRDVLEEKELYFLGLIAPGVHELWESYMDKFQYNPEKTKMVKLDASEAKGLAKFLIKEFSAMVQKDQCG